MAMEWSHTQEAYWYAKREMENLSEPDMQVVYAEIKASTKDEYGIYITSTSGLDPDKYEKELRRAELIPKDILARTVWEFMEEFRTCDNRGEFLWCCPYGCHMVPVGPIRKT